MGYRSHYKIAGFSMIEALVSLLVLSIGMLGLARLQANLWSNTSDLRTTSEALSMATSTAERFKASWNSRSAAGTTIHKTLTGDSGIFNATLTVSESAPEISLQVGLQWDNQNGEHSMQLPSSVLQPALDANVRWVLVRDYQVHSH